MHRNRAISMPQRQSLRRAISEEVVPIKFPNSTVDESVHSPSPIEHLSVDGCEIMLQSQNAVMKEELRSVASNLVANERDEASIRPKPQSSSIYLSGLALMGNPPQIYPKAVGRYVSQTVTLKSMTMKALLRPMRTKMTVKPMNMLAMILMMILMTVILVMLMAVKVIIHV